MKLNRNIERHWNSLSVSVLIHFALIPDIRIIAFVLWIELKTKFELECACDSLVYVLIDTSESVSITCHSLTNQSVLVVGCRGYLLLLYLDGKCLTVCRFSVTPFDRESSSDTSTGTCSMPNVTSAPPPSVSTPSSTVMSSGPSSGSLMHTSNVHSPAATPHNNNGGGGLSPMPAVSACGPAPAPAAQQQQTAPSNGGAEFETYQTVPVPLCEEDASAIYDLHFAYQNSLVVNGEKRGLSRDQANFSDLVNIAELSVRRVIEMAKQVPAFRALPQVGAWLLAWLGWHSVCIIVFNCNSYLL